MITGTLLKPDLHSRLSEPTRPSCAVPRAHERGAGPSRGRSGGIRLGIAVVVTLLALGLGARAQDPCVGFLERSIDSEGLKGADSVYAIDLDGDGDTDVLSASHNDHRIVWYENRGGSGPELEFEAHPIATDVLSASSVFAADIDGDGHPDVLSASRTDGTVAWYESDGGSNPRFRKRVVSSELLTPLAVFAADVDGDGDNDILSASFTDNKISWFENLRDDDAGIGVLFEEHVVTDGARGAASVFAEDLDCDGDTDILSASRLDGKISWFEHSVEDGEEGPERVFDEHVLTIEAYGANSVYAVNLDGQDCLDIVAASAGDDSIRWFQNDGEGGFTERLISDEAAGARSVFAEDLDADGDKDVLAASANDDTIAWYENEGGTSPTFAAKHVLSSDTVSADAVFAATINTDDDFMDVLSISSAAGETFTSDKLAWYRSDGTSPPQFTEYVIADTASGANAVSIADIDGDGALDFLAARSDNPLAWYQNDGTSLPSFARHEFAPSTRDATSVLGVDLDGEPGIDVVAGFPLDDTVAWYQHNGEASPGFTGHIISNEAASVESVFAADVDGDGNIDVLSASSEDDKIAWYHNDGVAPTPGFTEHIISTVADGARCVFAADLDGDEEMDVLSASSEDDKIAWYHNDGVDPIPEFTEHAISTEAPGARFVTAADLDNDGDADVITILSLGTIAWFENNRDGVGADLTFGLRVLGNINGLSELFVTDVDGDDDLDMVTISSGANRVVWFENNGGRPPVFSARVVPGSAVVGGRSVAAADLDDDADVDFLAGYQAEIVWYEQLDEICAGFDASGDGVIDGVELAWLSRAFGSSSSDPGGEWWASIDLNQDGSVDGDDLAILASFGVWGRTPDTCTYTCR